MIKKALRYEQLISRGLAAAITLAFMTAVRPDPEPGRAAAAMVGIMLYETAAYCIRYAMHVKDESNKYHTIKIYLRQLEQPGKEKKAVR